MVRLSSIARVVVLGQELATVGCRYWGNWFDGRGLLKVKVYEFALYMDAEQVGRLLLSFVCFTQRLGSVGPTCSLFMHIKLCCASLQCTGCTTDVLLVGMLIFNPYETSVQIVNLGCLGKDTLVRRGKFV